jgi:hypothetical protein
MLVFPWHICGTFKANEEPALEVEKLVQIGEQEMNSIFVECVAFCERFGVFLS